MLLYFSAIIQQVSFGIYNYDDIHDVIASM